MMNPDDPNADPTADLWRQGQPDPGYLGLAGPPQPPPPDPRAPQGMPPGLGGMPPPGMPDAKAPQGMPPPMGALPGQIGGPGLGPARPRLNPQLVRLLLMQGMKG